MRPLSNDLRQRILDAVDNHEGTQRELAERFAVNPSTIVRLLQLRRRTGSAAPRPHGGGKSPALDADGLSTIEALSCAAEPVAPYAVPGGVAGVLRACDDEAAAGYPSFERR